MKARRLLLALLAVGGLSACDLVEPGPRIPGPYDPGQNALPDAETVTALCGSQLGRRLVYASDTYVNLYSEWERYQAYFTAVGDQGVNPDEQRGLEDRRRNIEKSIDRHRTALATVRSTGSQVDGSDSARCDTDVVAVFETIVEAKADEITYVDLESARLLASAGGS